MRRNSWPRKIRGMMLLQVKNNIKTIFTRFLPGERFAFENLTGLRRIKINSKSGSKHRCCHENLEDYTRKILTELLSGHGSATTYNIFTQLTKRQRDVFRPFFIALSPMHEVTHQVLNNSVNLKCQKFAKSSFLAFLRERHNSTFAFSVTC